MTCSWPVDRTCLPAVDPDDLEAVLRRKAAEDLAVSVLWALSGRQFGACPVIARPCVEDTYRPGSAFWVGGPGSFPVFDGGDWRTSECGCGTRCSQTGPSAVHLPGPVNEIVSVDFEGVVLDESEYAVEGDRLIRAGGLAWPSQNLTRPLGEDGTWSVTYTRGVPVPEGVGVLTGILAKEFIDACSGGKCRLPRRVTSVSRQGVSYQMVDPTDIYTSGKTGLSEIDLWLASVNPNHISAAPRVR